MPDPVDFIEPGLCNEDPVSLASERVAVGDENADELHELALKIHKIIIREPNDQALLAESLRRLKHRILAANI
jgi:hypothetical protein